METGLQAVVSFWESNDVRIIRVAHWFGAVEVPIERLRERLIGGLADVTSGSAGRLVSLGSADFVITCDESDIRFGFCHEDELHVRASNTEGLNFFLTRRKELGLEFREEEAGAA